MKTQIPLSNFLLKISKPESSQPAAQNKRPDARKENKQYAKASFNKANRALAGPVTLVQEPYSEQPCRDDTKHCLKFERWKPSANGLAARNFLPEISQRQKDLLLSHQFTTWDAGIHRKANFSYNSLPLLISTYHSH